MALKCEPNRPNSATKGKDDRSADRFGAWLSARHVHVIVAQHFYDIKFAHCVADQTPIFRVREYTWQGNGCLIFYELMDI